jgi:hypothetical protein
MREIQVCQRAAAVGCVERDLLALPLRRVEGLFDARVEL